MSRGDDRGGGTWFAFIGPYAVELGRHDRQGWTRDRSCAIDTSSAETFAETLKLVVSSLRENTTSASQAEELRVVITDLLLPQTTLPWSEALLDRNGLATRSQEQLNLDGHRLGPGYRITVDDADLMQPRLVTGWPSHLLDTLDEMATALGARLTSVLPLSAIAWNAADIEPTGNRTQALAVVDDGWVMVAYGRGRTQSVASRTFEAAHANGSDSLRSLWTRLAMRSPELLGIVASKWFDLRTSPPEGPEPLGFERSPLLLRGAPNRKLALAAFSEGVHSAIDPLSHRRSAPRSRRIFAIAGWLVLGISGVLAWYSLSTAATAEREKLASRPGPSAPVAREAWRREELPRVRSVNAAINELNVPVFALLAALVPPRDVQVFVLSVDISPPGGGDRSLDSVKIVAEAQSVEDMTHYVAFVADRKPFSAAQLVRHEMTDSAKAVIRFTIDATWPR